MKKGKIILTITTVLLLFSGNTFMQTKINYLLPDKTAFANWEIPVVYARTCYVDNGNRDV